CMLEPPPPPATAATTSGSSNHRRQQQPPAAAATTSGSSKHQRQQQPPTILVINFGKSPSEVNQPIENPSEINLLENGKMNHPCDGKAWKYFDMMKPEFSGDPRNVRLGLAADGFKHSIFWDLEYWPFLLLKNNLDVMHIEKKALETLLNTLLQNDKSKDIY
ncbi:transposon, En/Spm-like protein, partial [Tanacetum coccineum]